MSQQTQIPLIMVAALLVSACGGEKGQPDAAVDAGASGTLTQVGHSDLMARGMNSAMAIIGDHAYVGSRTDGANHANAGVMIVDISTPENPTVVGMIGAPDQDLQAMTARELRGIPHKKQLVVLNFACGDLHDCAGGPAELDNFKIYDVSTPTAPVLLATETFGSVINRNPPHEFYLWQDPADADRILLFMTTPPGPPAFQVLDISDPQNMVSVAWDPIADGGLTAVRNDDQALHSVALTDDGTVGLFSSQGAGLYLVDTTNPMSGNFSLLANETRVDYSPPSPGGAHSAVMIPGRELAVLTDEIYPTPAFAGCPWGWLRIVDLSDRSAPVVVGEFRHEKNSMSACVGDRGPDFVTYTAHNTTNTENLSFVTWHSAGLQLLNTTDPTSPTRIAEFIPEPVATVATEDPALGGEPVLMWSYPIIRDGLIYVVDVRNGLYVLRYEGTYDEQVLSRAFREGNSNIQ